MMRVVKGLVKFPIAIFPNQLERLEQERIIREGGVITA